MAEEEVLIGEVVRQIKALSEATTKGLDTINARMDKMSSEFIHSTVYAIDRKSIDERNVRGEARLRELEQEFNTHVRERDQERDRERETRDAQRIALETQRKNTRVSVGLAGLATAVAIFGPAISRLIGVGTGAG